MRLALTSSFLLLSAFGCSKISSCRDKVSSVRRTSEVVEVDCEATAGQRPRDGCVTKELSCGDQVKGHTDGAQNNWDDEFYKGKFCTPFPSGYSGAERIYLLKLPTQTVADLWLDSPCKDLDLFTLRWRYDGRCPTTSHRASECEADTRSGGGHVRIVTTTREEEYLVAVDGKQGALAPFGLSIDCQGGVQ